MRNPGASPNHETDPQEFPLHRGGVLFNGPRILLANSAGPRPVIVAEVASDGRLRLPFSSDGTAALPVVANSEATESEIAEARKNNISLTLAPWEQVRRDAPIAFVFDLITVAGR